jgi:3-dehydroquinate synthase
MRVRKISVRLKHLQYDVFIERGLLARAGKLLSKLLPSKNSRCFIVTVEAVWKHWGERLSDSLEKAKIAHAKIEILDGERYKTLSSLERLAEQLSELRADRNSVILAFGGGVIGDVAGMLASVYMRGIPVVQIPTTLLAQVDASVGGKTGVNLRAGKNLLGTFHQPIAVLIDPEILRTLPEREFRSGLFEVIKCGVIRERKLFEFMLEKRNQVLEHHPDALERIIADSVSIKADVVAADEKESDLRRILNFGHTVGHALEADTSYKHFLHGEAVGWGMAAAAMIGVAVHRTSSDVARNIVSAVLAYSPLPEVTSRGAEIAERVMSDKKTVGGTMHFVLPRDIGKVEIYNKVPKEAVMHAVEHIRYLSRT